jgi:hypothetical protein
MVSLCHTEASDGKQTERQLLRLALEGASSRGRGLTAHPRLCGGAPPYPLPRSKPERAEMPSAAPTPRRLRGPGKRQGSSMFATPRIQVG